MQRSGRESDLAVIGRRKVGHGSNDRNGAVSDVPRLLQICTRTYNEAVCDDLDAHLHTSSFSTLPTKAVPNGKSSTHLRDKNTAEDKGALVENPADG